MGEKVQGVTWPSADLSDSHGPMGYPTPYTGSNKGLATIGDLSDDSGDSDTSANGVSEFLHGIIPERLFGILSEGEMRPSLLNIKSGLRGVYATKKKLWETPLNYAYAVPLGNDGVFY